MVNTLHDDLCDYYKISRLKCPTEEWPPNQPKSIVSVALIRYSDGRTHQELIEISERFKEGASAVDKLVSSHSRVSKDVSKIFASLPKRILIEGAPGIGKTVLAKEIAYLWADGKLLQNCKLVFLLYLRDPRLSKITSVEELVQLFCTKEVATYITTYLEKSNGENAAFIFDGFDEFPALLQKNSFITNIIKRGNLRLYRCTVVVTSRPTATLSLHDSVDRRIEILGFAKEEREGYISLSLDQSEQITLNKYLKLHPIINGLCFIPLHLAILLYLFKKDNLPNTLTEMNEFFVVHTIYRHLSKSNQPDECVVKTLTDLPKDVFKFVQNLSKLAFNGLQNNQLVFSYDEIKEVCPEVGDVPGAINGFGVLQAVQHYVKRGAGKTTSFNFLHFTMQEYLAALHVTTVSNEQQLSMMKETFWKSHFMFMWIMYVGIIGTESYAFDSFVHSKTCGEILRTNKKSLSQTTKMKYLHLFQCYAEAKSETIPGEISSIFSNATVKFTGTTLLPHHISSLMLFMSASTVQGWISLELQNCNLRNIGMDSLLEHVIKNHDIMSTLEYVDLSENGSSPWGVYCIIIKHGCVNSLTLCGDDGMHEHVREMVDSLNENKNLDSLTLCSIGSVGLGVVKKHLFNCTAVGEVNLSWKKFLVKESCIKLPCMQLNTGTAFINILYNSSKCSSTVINLSDEKITTEEVKLLSFGLSNNLTVHALNISSSKLSSDGTIAICKCFNEKSVLEELNLSHLSISVEVADAIAKMIHNTRLLKLDISDSSICDDGITVISSELKTNTTLQELSVAHNHITIEGAKQIADAIRVNLALQKLDMSCCKIHSNEALMISEAYKMNNTLQELIITWKNDQVTVNTADQLWNLNNKKLEKIGTQIVSQLLYNNMKVESLNISFNKITDDGMAAICDSLSSNNALKQLDISHNNKITKKGASSLAQALQVNTTLLKLDISYCSIPSEGIINISEQLKDNRVLQEFYCKHNSITIEGATRIAELIQLGTGLKVIDVSYCSISDEGALIISASCKCNKMLEKLVMSWKNIEDIKAKQEEGYALNTSALYCDLSGLNIGDNGALIISNVLFNNVNTENLNISHNNISDIQAIADCLIQNASCNIQALNLSSNMINIESATKIVTVIQVYANLKKLNISNCNIPGDVLEAISESLKNNTTLQELNMSYSQINLKRANKIAEVIEVNTTLQKLDISYCGIPDDGAVVISESYKNNKTIIELVMSWNNDQVTINVSESDCDLSRKNIGSVGGMVVSNLLCNCHSMVIKLDLSSNNLCDDGIIAISDYLMNNNKLRELILTDNSITTTGIKVIFDALLSNETLSILNISSNNISDDGIIAISDYLMNNNKLRELILTDNSITTTGIKVIFDALLSNETLSILNISSNNISDDGAVIISDYLKKINEENKLKYLYLVGISEKGQKIVWNAQKEKIKCLVYYK